MADGEMEDGNQMTPAGVPLRSAYLARFGSASDREMIARFNSRLAAGGVTYRLPFDFSLPGEKQFRTDGHPVFRELMIVEDAREIRAGVLLQHGTFYVREEPRDFCWLQLPLAESLVDRAHAPAFTVLMRETLRRTPFAASLGIGSMEEPYARFLAGWKWKHQPVPFLFYPVKPRRVFLGLRQLRRKRLLRIAASLAAHSGIGAVMGGALRLRRQLDQASGAYAVTEVPHFGGWADQIFCENLSKYVATVRRDATALNILYPPSEAQYIRLRIREAATGVDIGWVLLLHTGMRDNKYFGDLNVGTIVTGFGDPAVAPALIHAGLTHLAGLGADLVVANWSHKAWLGACRRLGFLSAPSNFFLFISPGGAPLLDASLPMNEIHLARGDCDAPSSLMASRTGYANRSS